MRRGDITFHTGDPPHQILNRAIGVNVPIHLAQASLNVGARALKSPSGTWVHVVCVGVGPCTFRDTSPHNTDINHRSVQVLSSMQMCASVIRLKLCLPRQLAWVTDTITAALC